MRKVDRELFKDKIEVSLDGRQIFYLFFGGAVVASLVFVLGVVVGKRVEGRAYADRSPSTVTEDPLAALDALAGESYDDLAFTNALRQRPKTIVSFGQGENEQAGKVVRTQIAALKEITGKAMQAQERAKQEAVRKVTMAANVVTEAANKAAVAQASNHQPVVVSPTSHKLTTPDKLTTPAKKNNTKLFTLQLSSFQSKREAKALVTKLNRSGYSPYVIEAKVEGKGRWFRVRLGKYGSYDAAIEAKKQFEQRQKVIAYVTRLPR